MIVTSSYYDNLVQTIIAEHLTSGGFSGPLYNLTLVLFQNNLPLNKATPWSDLVECTYSGYARVAGISWGNPLRQADGSYTILGSIATFVCQAASNFVPNVAAGWALIDTAASPNLIMAESFEAPFPFANPGDGFGLVVEYNGTIANPASRGQTLA